MAEAKWGRTRMQTAIEFALPGKKPAAKLASAAPSPGMALTRLRKVGKLLGPLAAKATSVDTFLVPVGVDAKKVASFTALTEEGLEVLESLEADLALLEKQAAGARLKKATGTLSKKPG